MLATECTVCYAASAHFITAMGFHTFPPLRFSALFSPDFLPPILSPPIIPIMLQPSLSLLLLCFVCSLLAAASAPVAPSDLFVQVTTQLESTYRGSYRAIVVALPSALNVTLDANVTVLLPADSLLLTGGDDGSEAGQFSWASYTSGGRQWLRVRGGDGNIDGAERSMCASNRPLLIVDYLNGWGDESYITVTDALNQWQRVPLVKQLPPIGFFLDSSCAVGSGGRVYWFFGLHVNSPPAVPNQQVWVGEVSDDGDHINIDWKQAKGNNTLAGLYGTLTGVHRNNSHLNGSDVLYAVDGFVSPNSTNSSMSMQPVSQIAASLDGVHWYPLSVPWTSDWPVQEALAISDNGVIAWTDTESAFYVSLDGGLTFGSCVDVPPFGRRNGASVTFDQGGYFWLVGGFDKTDVWRSAFSWNDYKALAQACGLEVPKVGIGLTQWPPAHVKGEVTRTTQTE